MEAWYIESWGSGRSIALFSAVHGKKLNVRGKNKMRQRKREKGANSSLSISEPSQSSKKSFLPAGRHS